MEGPEATKLRPRWMVQLATFILVGGLGAGINAGVYASFVLIGLHYVIASLVAWAASLSIGYLLNRRYAFRSTARISRSLPRVILVYASQQALALGGIAIMTELGGVGPILAYVLMMPPAIILSFVAMKYFAFRGGR